MSGTGFPPDRVAEVFGQILRTARNGAGLSQVQLAEKAGIGRTLIQLYERGLHDPGLSKVINIADVLGMQASQLVAMVVSRLRRESAHGDR
jgi:transcriptional regulator with XRE-family HTH domain